MKKDIHPQYNNEVEVKCACGSMFKVGSTSKNISIEICNECHPFYTGKEKLVDSTGRVDRFKQRMEKTTALKTEKKEKSKKENTPKKKTSKKKN